MLRCYGIAAPQNVAFLGEASDPTVVGGVTSLSIPLLASAWMSMRRRVVAQPKPQGRGSARPTRQPAVDEG